MSLWLDGAKHIDAWQDGGSMLGGAKRAIWHTTENDPKKTTAANIAHYLNRVGYQAHLIWNPVTGEIVQMIPANRAGRALANTAGGIQTNRIGGICIQIEVVGRAANPFTSGPMKGREQILTWLRGLGVPDVWPGGPPTGTVRHVSARVWNSQRGHYSHSQVPENNHHDPGAIDIRKLLGDDISAEDVWQHQIPIPKGWGKDGNPDWNAGYMLVNIGEHLRLVEAKLAAIEKKLSAPAKK